MEDATKISSTATNNMSISLSFRVTSGFVCEKGFVRHFRTIDPTPRQSVSLSHLNAPPDCAHAWNVCSHDQEEINVVEPEVAQGSRRHKVTGICNCSFTQVQQNLHEIFSRILTRMRH